MIFPDDFHILFRLLWLQLGFMNIKILFKWPNWKNWPNKFTPCSLFGTPCFGGSLMSVWKQRYYFPYGGRFKRFYVVKVLCWHKHGWTSVRTFAVIVFVSHISVSLWFFSGSWKWLWIISVVGISINLLCGGYV